MSKIRRIYNAAKRRSTALPPSYQFEGFHLDLERYELRRAGHPLKLERIPMELLILLVGRQGALVSRDEIVAKLWGRDVFIETEHGINTAVRKIRQTLRDDPERPRFVETVVGKGYRFVAAVSIGASGPRPSNGSEARIPNNNGTPVTHEPTAHDQAPLETTPRGSAPHGSGAGHGADSSRTTGSDSTKAVEARGKRSHAKVLFAAVSATVVIALLLLAFVRYPRRALPNHRIILAVLPFTNLSGDPAEEYLSDGMTEEVITALGQVNVERLGVIARTSAMHYKHRDSNVREIAHELGAEYVLEGGVRRAGNRIRVTAQLVAARDQTNLWSQDYDILEFSEIPSVQAQIRNAVAKTLQLRTDTKLDLPASVQPEAYQLYLKGRYFLDRRDRVSLQKALEYFQQSAARDGNFARAWAGAALSFELLEYVRAISPHDSYPNALSAARRAVQIDPESAEGHTALAYIHQHYEWNWTEAERELVQALALDPNYELARQWYSYGFLGQGDFQRALAEMRHALALDPVSLRVNVTMAERLERAGQRDEAIRQYLTALELSPDDADVHARLGNLYAKKGAVILAVTEYRRSLQLSGDQELEKKFDELNARTGFAAACSAVEAERFRAALHSLDVRAARGEYVSPSDYALIYVNLNDRKRALEWLHRAYEEHASIMLELNSPIFDSVRDTSEFREVVRRVNMRKFHPES